MLLEAVIVVLACVPLVFVEGSQRCTTKDHHSQQHCHEDCDAEATDGMYVVQTEHYHIATPTTHAYGCAHTHLQTHKHTYTHARTHARKIT